MFDLAWTEIALILLVALVVIGPKDLPHAIRGVADFIKKARRMAAEFQVHVDEMMREAKLDEVKRQIDEVRAGAYDFKRRFEEELDPNREIAKTLADPFATATPDDDRVSHASSPGPEPTMVAAEGAAPSAAPAPEPPLPPDEPPAFLPPSVKRDGA
ncbi:MAG: Sec-independent protein translocase protein TatB [Elioraea sp.]|nr:Sec-independent protein translocase protein TatB [Elioraea sp.]